MSSLHKACCINCSYQAQALEGWEASKIKLEPKMCVDCRDIVSVVIQDEHGQGDAALFHCPQCRGVNLFAWDNSAIRALPPAAGVSSRPADQLDDKGELVISPGHEGWCPRCGDSMNIPDEPLM